jgi:hypothetical protein
METANFALTMISSLWYLVYELYVIQMYLFRYEYVVLAYFKAAAATSISFLKLLLIHKQ